LVPPLTVVTTVVFDDKRAVPFKLLHQFERQAALGDVPLVLARIETDGHFLLYIRIYVNAIAAQNAA